MDKTRLHKNFLMEVFYKHKITTEMYIPLR